MHAETGLGALLCDFSTGHVHSGGSEEEEERYRKKTLPLRKSVERKCVCV